MSDSKRIVVAMSGGVDSSTAAALLKKQGHEVIGIGLSFPALGGDTECGKSCCGGAGMNDARRVASVIGIPFYVLDYEDVFEKSVIDYFCRSYLKGETPNPCVECNRAVKFGRLLAEASKLGAGILATGHYARVLRMENSGRHILKKGLDPEKEQSYFLYSLTQEQLGRALFPLGEMTKGETREAAGSFGLPVSEKPASQDICFLGNTSYRELLAQRYPESILPGPIVDTEGNTLGKHRGIANYTVGQRRGVGVATGVPLYVLSVHAETRTIVVGTREEAASSTFSVRDMNWIAFDEPPGSLEVRVTTRYRSPEVEATVEVTGDGRARVTLSEPRVAAPGQSAVFYDEDTVVGGGIIEGETK